MVPKDLVWCLLFMSEIEMNIVEGHVERKGFNQKQDLKWQSMKFSGL
jgi:hypothetical protein